GYPRLVQRLRLELPLEHIGRDGQGMLGVGGASEATLLPRHQAVGAHEARDALFAYAHAARAQIGVDTRAAIGPATLAVHGGNLQTKRGVGLRPGGRRTLAPSVVATARDVECVAQDGNGVTSLLRRNERKLHLLSFAKKAAAFFNISRSISSRLFSRRSRWSSS